MIKCSRRHSGVFHFKLSAILNTKKGKHGTNFENKKKDATCGIVTLVENDFVLSNFMFKCGTP